MQTSFDGLPDAELLERAWVDANAFAAFYRRHERLVLGWLMRQTRRADLAADLASEVLLHGQRPPAPDRTLPLVGRPGTSSLSDHRGQVVILSFGGAWCPPRRQQATTLNDMQPTLRTMGGATALLVDAFDQTRPAEAFVKQHHLTLPVLADKHSQLARLYRVKAFPTTFVIDPRGRLVAIIRGRVGQAFLERVVRQAQQPSGTTVWP